MPGEPTPQYLGASGRRIFSLYFNARLKSKSSVLLIPPFAEEMNKSRRMYSELARNLSAGNQNVLLFDFYGTGDSEGLLKDAVWQDWIEDIQNCVSTLYNYGAEQISFLGLRTGALLASDYLSKCDDKIHKLLLWQPVIDGRIFLSQFMRLRLASSMMRDDASRETAKDLKAQLSRGDSLEIAGYSITPAIASSMEITTLKKLPPGVCDALAWFDLVPDEQRELPLVSRKLVEHWQEQGVNVTHQKIVGIPFWSSTEIIVNPELIEVSRRFFDHGGKDL